MSVIYLALPIALGLGAAGLFACLYCIRSGQFDDLDTPSVRILNEERPLTHDAE
ncbi:MAG: cbb3-type cytochrome oxidase assembly protein CcoS [Planctomycetota bacterium]